ncbi:MAG TPA: transposase [Candidatus Saccharimonadales bacterium]|nr:transposase [Candidatus Saccharimonadales bacterium]
MPSRNVIKIDVEESYYHAYARGHGRQKIFKNDEDYRAFLDLLKRYLSVEEMIDKYGKPYAHLRGQIELLGYCLMDNHFHLLLYQAEKGSMSKLMRSIMTSYSTYFNKKYDSTGALFESRYKASRISSDSYLTHISRYIHLSPGDWRAYPYSSISAYFGIGLPEWLQPGRVVKLFGSLPVYADFLDDSEDYEKSLDEIKHELANRI